MKTSIIDQHKKDKQEYDTSLSGMLSTFMQSQFQAAMTKFQGLTTSSPTSIPSFLSLGASQSIQPLVQPESIRQTENLNKLTTTSAPQIEKLQPVNIQAESAPVEKNSPPQHQTKAVYGDAEIQSIVQEASQKHGVPVALINAVIKQESNFNPKAVSHAGARGLMQLMPGTAKDLGVTDSFDARQNIMGGAKYLGQMMTRYKGDVTLSLAGYNAGPGNVAKYGNTVPPFKETQNYVVKVGNYYKANLAAMQRSSQSFAQNNTSSSSQDA